MTKRLPLLLSLMLILLFAAAPGAAQRAPDWGVAVFADGTQQIQVLTADGVSATIGAGAIPLRIGTFPSAPLAAISPNRHALAVLDFAPQAAARRRLNVSIAANGSCCQTVRLTQGEPALAQIGGFSPNGRRFAVSSLAITDAAAGTFTSEIAVVDVELGAVVTRLDSSRIGGDFAWVKEWNDDGIVFLPTCYACDQAAPQGRLSRWNPETDEITTNIGAIDPAQDVLPVTGETIALARRGDYPLPVQGDAPNVVTFGGRVIYYNPRNLEVSGAHWVADGWQVLVEHANASVLIDRSGVQRPVNSGDQFLVGTPDGWLATRAIDGGAVEVLHHTLTNLDGKVIARFYHPVAVIQQPQLGATASRGGFPDVPSPVSRITCPNALPPRLITGGKGRVISGGVNLRREPSVTADAVVMITTEEFNVIAGPNCDPTGIAWWEVGIGGLRGWMAESNDGVYLLEPVLN